MLKNGFVDMWITLHPNEAGHTQGSGRLDRVTVKDTKQHWKMKEIRIIADHPVKNVFISDHFGLVAKFKLKAI